MDLRNCLGQIEVQVGSAARFGYIIIALALADLLLSHHEVSPEVALWPGLLSADLLYRRGSNIDIRWVGILAVEIDRVVIPLVMR